MASKTPTNEAVEKQETEVKAATKKATPKAKEAKSVTEETKKAKKPVAAKTSKSAEKTVKEKAEKATVKAVAEKKEAKAVKKTETAATEKAPKATVKAATEGAEKPTVKAVAEEKEKKPAKQTEKPEKAVKAPAETKETSTQKEKEGKTAKTKKLVERPRLKRKYFDEVLPTMKERFQYKNVMQIPRLEKITLSMGLGAEKDNPKGMETAAAQLGLIAGQKVVIIKAKKSVANFKVRAGMNIGAKVTLRGDRMYYFADKLMNIVLPRVRDFRGVSENSFDGRGNYALGLKEQLIFPEINYDDVDKVRGMNVVFVTSAKTDEEAKALLNMLGMPFAQGG